MNIIDDTIGFASLIFFSGPLGILFIVNLALFSLTLKYCNKVKKEIFRMQSSNMEKPALRRRFFMDKTRFIMNTKLCFVMGITWLLEIISILFYDHKKSLFWSISDSFNVLLGVFVFVIFVFKRRVWNEVLYKFGKSIFILKTKKKKHFFNFPRSLVRSHCAVELVFCVLCNNGNIQCLTVHPNLTLLCYGVPEPL